MSAVCRPRVHERMREERAVAGEDDGVGAERIAAAVDDDVSQLVPLVTGHNNQDFRQSDQNGETDRSNGENTKVSNSLCEPNRPLST